MSWHDTTLHEINCTYDYDDNYADNDDDDDEYFSNSTQRVRVVRLPHLTGTSGILVCIYMYIYNVCTTYYTKGICHIIVILSPPLPPSTCQRDICVYLRARFSDSLHINTSSDPLPLSLTAL